MKAEIIGIFSSNLFVSDRNTICHKEFGQLCSFTVKKDGITLFYPIEFKTQKAARKFIKNNDAGKLDPRSMVFTTLCFENENE